MHDLPMLVTVAAVGFGLVAVGWLIHRVQSRAKTCNRHDHRVGQIATLLGWGALLGGVCLLALSAYSLVVVLFRS